MALKTFKEYISDVEAKSHEKFVFYHFDPVDKVAEVIIRLLLNEEKPSVELGKGRSILFHKAHVPNTQDHLHFQVKGAKIAAINKDGTAHDKSHGITLQKWAIEGAAKHYPDFKMPKDKIIEHLMAEPGNQVLNEGFEEGNIIIPRTILTLALVKAGEGN